MRQIQTRHPCASVGSLLDPDPDRTDSTLTGWSTVGWAVQIAYLRARAGVTDRLVAHVTVLKHRVVQSLNMQVSLTTHRARCLSFLADDVAHKHCALARRG